ncbi:AMP-binding enzyme [Penicillium paradoxum]|uniref:AMP-binding enzyme n=1 Tax=Penicillium paradoxum TaxID=176176 RepID=UPI002547BB72|nr:AMP-binding enzyme [Penicillium paradoxum]KAJ5773449.1 AMP-binding enzyme [Penicillium paradoxum]
MTIYQTREISVPRDVNLTELLHSSPRDEPTPPSHVITTDSLTNRSLTLGELRDHAGRLAQGFKTHLNAQDRDRWALILPSSVELVELFHAVLWSGGTACPINHALKAKDIAHALAVSRPKYVVAYTGALKVIEEAIQLGKKQLAKANIDWKTPVIITVIGKRIPGYQHVPKDFLEDEPLPIPHWDDTSDRIATIHLTSGTTGSSKGIQLSHYNFVAQCHQLWHHDPNLWPSDYRLIGYTPWVHIAMTTVPMFLGPWAGLMHHAMPSFNIDGHGALTKSIQPTAFQGAPSALLPLLRNPKLREKYDLSRMKHLLSLGSGDTEEYSKGVLALADWQQINIYGMTEASPYIAYKRHDSNLPRGVVGHLMPSVKAKLKVPGTFDDAPKGSDGELWVSGPNLASEYIGVGNMDETNAAAFPEPGWYNTGDVCKISEDGVLSVVGRTKEQMKYKGFQVNPAELDVFLLSHPHVLDGAVGSIWDDQELTELPTAYVVLRPECKGKEPESLRRIQRDFDTEVGGYKKLRGGVWAVTQIPRNITHKVLRKELKNHITGLCSLEKSQTKL